MSNRFKGNVIVIDATDTQIGSKDAGIGPKGPLRIKLIQWVSTAAKAIANDNDLTIEWGSVNGDIIIAARACVHETAASQDIVGAVFYEANFAGKPWEVNEGLFVEDLDSGELIIFLD